MNNNNQDNQNNNQDQRRNRRIQLDENDEIEDQNQQDSIEQAEEQKGIIEENDDQNSQESEGEDIIQDMEKDYEPQPELDRYESEGLDDQEISDDGLDIEVRQNVEEKLNQRDKQLFKDQKQKQKLEILRDFTDESDEDDDLRRQLRRQIQQNQQIQQIYDEEEVEEQKDDQVEDFQFIDHEDTRGKLHIWIRDQRTIRYIVKIFKQFLFKFKIERNDGNNQIKNQQQQQQQKFDYIYLQRIQEMCSKNKQSLEVTFGHVCKNHMKLSEWIAEEPSIILPYLNQVAFNVVNKIFPGYSNIQPEIYVRIKDLPLYENIRDLRQNHLNKLVNVKGVVTRRTPVFSQLKKATFICGKCGEKKGPIFFSSSDKLQLGVCVGCQSKGPFSLDNENTLYRNYQKVTIQESPGSVPPGRVPRQKDVILLADNIDIARPGDEIEVTGIYIHRYDYALNVKHGFPIFSTLIEANYVKRVSDVENFDIPEEDIKQIQQWSKKENIDQIIINSIAPSIYGHHHVKTALALSMFGGEAKDVGGKHKIRGDINVLVLGDPGVAKSQFLKSVEKTFYRCVYTTGKGASAVGLTASVKKDPQTKEWTLEGGALVLADKGICLIDEFDKMNEHDRTSIHEAMEQQSISISKAGIVANLQARCAIIAAANPVKGRYDSQKSFSDNVDLTDPILSRFDILCVVKDEVFIDQDSALASFVINSHIKNHPKAQQEFNKNPELYNQYIQQTSIDEPEVYKGQTMPQDILKKYIMYSRQNKHPKISDINKEKITKFYTDLRAESSISGGINIAVRHIESIIRMAEARAKIFLRDYVRNDDIDMAISVMLESFIQSQKYSIAKNIQKKFSHYVTFKEDYKSILMNILDKLYKEQQVTAKIHKSTFEKESKKKDIHNIEGFLTSQEFKKSYKLNEDGYIISIHQ